MRSNAGMANRQGDVELHFTQVSAPPVSTLAWLGSEHSCSTTLADTSKRKKVHRSVGRASQQHSAPQPDDLCLQLHQSQPLQSTVDLRPVSRTSNGTSLLAANQRPLHYTAARLYAVANTIGESPVTDTKINTAF